METAAGRRRSGQAVESAADSGGKIGPLHERPANEALHGRPIAPAARHERLIDRTDGIDHYRNEASFVLEDCHGPIRRSEGARAGRCAA